MNAFGQQLRLGLVLNARNPMALIYGFLFPLIFLFSFWAIYRHDRVPLALHMGELLTVTVLGGACFGLPTAMVAERERGVWRRYRLTPVSMGAFVGGTLATRYILLVAAGVMQIAVAMAIGMPPPSHPLELFAAFSVACLAFLGLGLIIAALADTVPAVQALGQCIFLPMLMIGGIAVRLSSLPEWALHASAFFPGRYAVEALGACVTGDGLTDAGFATAALLLIAAAAALAGTRMFRWDSGQRFATRGGKRWIALALGMWLAVGVLAIWQGRVAVATPPVERAEVPRDYVVRKPAAPRSATPKPAPALKPALVRPPKPAIAKAATPVVAKPPRLTPVAATPPAPTPPSTWRSVTAAQFAEIAFDRLPPDTGLVSPIARAGEEPDAMVGAQLDGIRAGLESWPPAKVDDPVQRARNLLFVAAVPDVLQMEQVERHLPALIYERLRADVPEKDLKKILYWIAMHPDEGDDAAVRQLEPLGLPAVNGPTRTARARVMLYAFKLLGRLTGNIAP